MKIKELQARQGKADITAEVVEVGESRSFSKFGKEGKVANAVIKDDSGKIKLSLWNEQIDQVKPGDTVEIKNGYVSEWQGELQLTTGKFGSLNVVSAGGSGSAAQAPAKQDTAPAAKKAQGDAAEEGENPVPLDDPFSKEGDNGRDNDGDDLVIDEERID